MTQGIQRMSIDDETETVALMNDPDYGLTDVVYSSQRGRAMGLLGQVSSGSALTGTVAIVLAQDSPGQAGTIRVLTLGHLYLLNF